MEILFSQKLEYSEITPYKNYSTISKKIETVPLIIETDNNNDDNDDDWFLDPNISDMSKLSPGKMEIKQINRSNDCSIYLDLPSKKRGKYFYADFSKTLDRKNKYSSCDENVQVNLDFALERKCFYTTNERHLKQHCHNPFSSIIIYNQERSIVRRGDKITLKYYQKVRRREFNWRFFKESMSVTSITIDTKTGNFTTADIDKSEARNRRKFRVNYFPELFKIIYAYNNLFGIQDKTHIPEFNQIFDDFKFFDAIKQVFGYTDSTLENRDLNGEKLVFTTVFLDYFVKTKKIKIPNDYFTYLVYYYPTERYFKKNNRKLINAVLDRYGIKSKVTNKILHTVPNVDVVSLVKLCNLFGDNYYRYIGNIKPESLDTIIYSMGNIDHSVLSQIQSYQYDNPNYFPYDLSEREKENVISILNSLKKDEPPNSSNQVYSNKIKQFHQSLVDHFSMIENIRPYYPDACLRARTYDNYNREHLEYSRLNTLVKKSVVIEYAFEEETITDVEKPIKKTLINNSSIDDNVYALVHGYTDDDFIYPYLLKREEEYVEESSFMHHCVSGYANKDTSIIVSLRTKDNDDRVTCEFDIRSGNCLQARHIQNHAVPEIFTKPLDELKNRILNLSRRNKLKWTEKKKVKLQINGIDIQPIVDEQQVPQPIGVMAEDWDYELPFI